MTIAPAGLKFAGAGDACAAVRVARLARAADPAAKAIALGRLVAGR